MTGLLNLRAANVARDQEWNTGSERVSMTFRATELAGEVGEACNVIKKLERERIGLVGSRDTKEHLAEELADIVICTDLVAMDAGIDLDAAIAAKFNATSEKNGLATRLSVSDPAARTLALEEAARNLIAVRYDTYTARNGKLCSIEGDDGEKAWIVPFDAMADLESALSSPDHADAGKVEGDARADLERFWRPISEADRTITYEDTFNLGDGKSMTIRNSDHFWVRDADGRVYEATWSDHKGGYWWDLEGESPVDPIEYMPHPLFLRSAPASEKEKS